MMNAKDSDTSTSQPTVTKGVIYAFRCLLPGILLILAASALLLITDRMHRTTAGDKRPRIAIFQLASRPVLDDCVAGALQGLAEQGLEPGRDLEVRTFNSENDLTTANAMARTIEEGGNRLVITFSTPLLQVMANVNKEGKIRHIFGAVTDPFAAGVGITRSGHPPHLAGIGTFQPVRETFRLAKRLLPGLRSVGVVWNPADAASEACLLLARDECARLGIKLLEAQVENSAGVAEAAASLTGQGIQALWIGGDNTVEMAMDSLVKAGRQAGIPVLSNAPSHLKAGAFLSLGADYVEVGRQTGILAARVLKGLDTATVPVNTVVPQQLALNLAALKGVREKWQVDAETRARAAILIDESGRAVRTLSPLPKEQALTSRRWNIQLIDYADAVNAEETHEGLYAELKALGLREGRDYDLKRRSAHGDMTVMNEIMDAVLTDRPDLIITTATPALQTAVGKIKKIPVIFTTVADGVLAGAGKSANDHLPNITGVTTMSDFDGMIATVRECMPGVKRIGTLYAPSEVNSVLYRDALVKAASAKGLKVESVAVSSATDVSDAALALAGNGVQAITQISDDVNGSATGTIATAAARAGVPLFAFVSKAVTDGAAVAVARDYREAGRLAARLALRVMRGEDPGRIPFTPLGRSVLVVSRKNAAKFGLRIPRTVLNRADKVVD
jgi:ABC-type uncharacterized transport system substrate-binding protein